MIAQNTTKLENQFLIDEAQSLYKAKFITKEQFNEIQKILPTSKKQKNMLLRIGFAILGMLLYCSICGFISLIAIDGIEQNFNFLIFIYAAIGFIGTEFFAKKSNSEQGLEDSFLILAQLSLAVAIGFITDGYELIIAAVATGISLLTYLRYINTASILVFCIASTATIAYAILETGTLGNSILPFILMIYTSVLYFISNRISTNISFPFYHKGIVFVKYFSIIVFYISGNYLVVCTLSQELSGSAIALQSNLPLTLFFYAFTLSVPVLYLIYGLKKLDRGLLWIGFLSIGFSFYSIGFYYKIPPIEIVLTLAGLLLFAVAYFSIKKLKYKTQGITFQEDRFINSNHFIPSQALLITSQFGLKPEQSVQSPMEFGGGGYSGGGSSGSF